MRRVNGDLAVSRALGDYVYKVSPSLPAEAQQVSPEPEVKVVARDAAADQFLVLACDGIWDVMTNEEVAAWIVGQVGEGVESLTELAELLLDECLARGSRDNMSVVIVAFPAAPKPTAEAVERHKRAKAARIPAEGGGDMAPPDADLARAGGGGVGGGGGGDGGNEGK
jgi:protein phosphatase 1B